MKLKPGFVPGWNDLAYIESTRRYRAGKAYFIDKMPNNFSSIGFLHLILPNAKVIDARRHPLDSCLGSYKQLFFKGQSFTYEQFELGHYYLEYRRIMEHWRNYEAHLGELIETLEPLLKELPPEDQPEWVRV